MALIYEMLESEPINIPQLPLAWLEDTLRRCLDKNASTRATIEVRLASWHLHAVAGQVGNADSTGGTTSSVRRSFSTTSSWPGSCLWTHRAPLGRSARIGM